MDLTEIERELETCRSDFEDALYVAADMVTNYPDLIRAEMTDECQAIIASIDRPLVRAEKDWRVVR